MRDGTVEHFPEVVLEKENEAYVGPDALKVLVSHASPGAAQDR